MELHFFPHWRFYLLQIEMYEHQDSTKLLMNYCDINIHNYTSLKVFLLWRCLQRLWSCNSCGKGSVWSCTKTRTGIWSDKLLRTKEVLTKLTGKICVLSYQYRSGCLIASNLFHIFTLPIKSYTFHYHALKSTNVWKVDSSNRQ